MTVEPLLTPEQIARLTGMSYHGVLRDIRARKLKATKKGKAYRVEVAWYRDWLELDVVADQPQRPRRAAAPPRRGPVAAGSVAALDAIERDEAAA